MVLFVLIGIVILMLGLAQLIIWLSAIYTLYFGNFAHGKPLNSYEIWMFTNPTATFFIAGTEIVLFVIFANIFSYLFVSKLRLIKKNVSAGYEPDRMESIQLNHSKHKWSMLRPKLNYYPF